MITRGEVNHWGEGKFYKECAALLVFLSALFSSVTFAQLGQSDVLILVNANSYTSKYIAKMYRSYYPQITNGQVLELSGLADCSGPQSTAANEIITRQQYNTLIADPLRNYLLANNLAATIKVIVTTAGMPYRIEDTLYPNVIYPAGSNYTDVSSHLSEINAASVESELTCLWYSDYGPNPFGIDNRMVNPYQGYHQSSVTLFEKLPPGSKQMNWTQPICIGDVPPKMEGIRTEYDYSWFGTYARSFNAGDIYLTCRLDGPKNLGKSAVFAVRKMLERAKRASNSVKGVNPAQAVIVLDDAPVNDATPNAAVDESRIYNLDGRVNYIIYESGQNQPPDAKKILKKDDLKDSYTVLTNRTAVEGSINVSLMTYSGLAVLLDRRNSIRTSQTDLDALLDIGPLNRQGSQTLVALACYGKNGDEGSPKEYLLTGGPNSGPLFSLANGAVFTSLESFNAVTFFSNAVTTQAKIVDFISIGGAGAIGHAFEPVSDATIDNLYFLYNLFADENGDKYADLTFVEAAFTGIPYLSWAEVVIGDPLMRIAYGPGEAAWSSKVGDCNMDGVVNARDIRIYSNCVDGELNSTNPLYSQIYNDVADFNCDGKNDARDLRILQDNLY